MNGDAAKFFDEWSIYEQVLERDYMFHDEIYRGVARLLADYFSARPFSVLDLGCGSARHFSHALAGRSLAGYTGYDLSAAPLPHARRNLAALGCAVELGQSDLLDALRRESRSFDLVFCGFSLHHLSAENKAAFFDLAHRRLSNGGMLLVVDTARGDEEALPAYLERYCGWITSDWRGMAPEAIAAICEHIRSNDHPEAASDIRRMGLDAGFARCRELDRFRWHHTWSFEKGFSPAVRIRPPAPEDAAGIAQTHVDSWRTTYTGIIPDDYIAKYSLECRERTWRQILSDAARREFVCVAEDAAGAIVGFVSGGPERAGKAASRGEIYAIYVRKPFQRRGIGRRLTAALARRLSRAGYDSIIVWVLAQNPSRGFYAVLGGTVVDEKPSEIAGAKLPEVAYEWRDTRALLD